METSAKHLNITVKRACQNWHHDKRQHNIKESQMKSESAMTFTGSVSIVEDSNEVTDFKI
jgi:hypothetical protein